MRRFACVQLDWVWRQAWVKALAADKFVFLFAADGLHHLDPLYAGLWTIEQCFQNLKRRGFNWNAPHLRCLHKRRKLGTLVSLAYAFCLGVATYGGRQSIARKSYGHRAASLSRHGLKLLRQLPRPLTTPEDPLVRMAKTILNWITGQLARNQLLKIVG